MFDQNSFLNGRIPWKNSGYRFRSEWATVDNVAPPILEHRNWSLYKQCKNIIMRTSKALHNTTRKWKITVRIKLVSEESSRREQETFYLSLFYIQSTSPTVRCAFVVFLNSSTAGTFGIDWHGFVNVQLYCGKQGYCRQHSAPPSL